MDVKETRFGVVDRDGLEELSDEFDTMQLLNVLDDLDKVRDRIDGFRANLLALHGMATHVLNGAPAMDQAVEAEDIHELVEIVDSEAFDMIEAAESIQALTRQLEKLDSEAALAARGL